MALILAIAAVIQIWLAGSLFGPARGKLVGLTTSPKWFLRWPARGALCHFCVSVWLALLASTQVGLVEGLATILPVNVTLVIFTLLTQRLPRLVDLRLKDGHY